MPASALPYWCPQSCTLEAVRAALAGRGTPTAAQGEGKGNERGAYREGRGEKGGSWRLRPSVQQQNGGPSAH